MSLGARTRGGAGDDATSPFAIVAGSSATAPDIKRAARTRRMLGRVMVRTGVGRRRMAGTIDHAAWPAGAIAWAVMPVGNSSATTAIIQTRRRARIMSAAAAVEHFQ